MKDIEKEISEIVERRYNGYRGTFYKNIRKQHEALRFMFGPKFLLYFLRGCEQDNPKPKYKMPVLPE